MLVDEAYTLCSPFECDSGKKTIETLMINMNNNINQNIKNLIMIFAGYKEQMNGFFNESRPDETCENSFEFCRFFLQRNFVTPQNVKFYNSPSDVSLGIE